MKINAYKVDKAKVLEGTWTVLSEDLEILVARYPNERYDEELARCLRKASRQLRRRSISRIITDPGVKDAQCKAVARCVLLGWRNMEDDQGNVIEYTSAKAYELFKEYPDFYNEVLEVAADISLFSTEQEEDELGN